jgi:acyl carrier protein
MNEKKGVREFLTTLVGKDIPFADDDSLLATQLIDSLKVAELIVFLEGTYNVTFDGDDLTPENLDTVNAITSFLERKGVERPEV